MNLVLLIDLNYEHEDCTIYFEYLAISVLAVLVSQRTVWNPIFFVPLNSGVHTLHATQNSKKKKMTMNIVAF